MRRTLSHSAALLSIIVMLIAPVTPFASASQDTMSQGFEVDPRVEMTLVWRDSIVRPGDTATLGVVMDVMHGWHVQAGAELKHPDVLYPSSVKVELPAGWTAGPARWPEPVNFTVGDGEGALNIAGYEGSALAAVTIPIPSHAQPGEYEIKATLEYQACNERTCERPTSTTKSIVLTIAADDAAAAAGAIDAGTETLFAALDDAPVTVQTTADAPAAPAAFLVLLGLAVLGGFILNFTPCVLPVIPLKVMALAKSGGARGRTLVLGFAMFAGILAFWLALGLAVGSLDGLATNVLFQKPWFPIGIGVIITIFAVSSMGVFTFQPPKWAYKVNPSHDTVHGSFLFGILTAILSTPCTAPFMGGAIAASVGQERVVVLAVFAAIGIGMALPYLFLSAFPRLAHRMPRTGPASEVIKQVLGLILFAVAAYFVGIGISGLFHEEGEAASRSYWWFVGLFGALAGMWLIVKTIRITSSPPRRLIFGGIGAILIASAALLATGMTAKSPIEWVYYTPQRLQDELEAGNVVLLKFTAEWCANCHFLERTVINSDAVVEALDQAGVTAMKVDITSDAAEGNLLLVKYWRSIPYLVIQRPDGSVAFQADWYTAQDVVNGIDAALGE